MPHTTLPFVGLLPWVPPWPWCGHCKVWQEMFNPVETRERITKARDMAAGSAGEEVLMEGVSWGASGMAVKSRGQTRSEMPCGEQVVSAS